MLVRFVPDVQGGYGKLVRGGPRKRLTSGAQMPVANIGTKCREQTPQRQAAKESKIECMESYLAKQGTAHGGTARACDMDIVASGGLAIS